MTLFKKYSLHIVWIISLSAVLGSLYISNILHLPPCSLCWYQRIFMYPLALIVPIGILSKDKNVSRYVLGLSIPGAIIAIYHHLLQMQIIPEIITPCSVGISCVTKTFLWYGFVTLPLLSFTAFLLIILCVWYYKKGEK
jgi:disulfide bond formation protein DsbB